jgi:tetratricopeptide (TPR) repeat protein
MVAMNDDLAKIQRNPRDLGRWQKAQEQLLGGRHGPALSGYRELVRRYPAVPELWFELGNAASGELDFARANHAYRRARELAPHNAGLLSMIGLQYQGLRQLDDARTCYEDAVAADPDSVDARARAGEAGAVLPGVWLSGAGRAYDDDNIVIKNPCPTLRVKFFPAKTTPQNVG